MTKGKLYGVGIGPGDKELITLKAVRILKSADIIALPDSASSTNRAYEIIKEHIKEKEIIYCPMPMVKDKDVLKEYHNNSALEIQKYLDMGKTVAFATLGDPSIYSTYMYIHRIIEKNGYTVEMVAGVTSFCASAARLNMSIADGGEPVIIIPASYEHNKELLKIKGSKILMKSGKGLSRVKEEINELGLEDITYMVENCGMSEEKVYYNFKDVPDKSSYFSLIIVKDNMEE